MQSRKRLIIVLSSRFILIVSTLIIIRSVLMLPKIISLECPKGDICNMAGQKVDVWGKVVSVKSERLEKTQIEIEIEKIPQKNIRKSKILIILPYVNYPYFYGDRLLISGKPKIPNNFEESNFSYPLYLKGKSIYSIMVFPEVKQHIPAEEVFCLTIFDKYYRKILFLREIFRRNIQSVLKEPDGSIVGAFIIGDQNSIPENIRSLFGKIGIIHILSVSGAHVTLIIFILTWLLSKVFSKKIYCLVLVFLAISFYLVLSGSPSCALRSGIMGLLAFFALSQKRISNLKIMLWFSATALLLYNPLLIVSDIGFELSFLAVFGMGYIYPIFEKLFLWGKEGPLSHVLKTLILSISIEIAVLPLVFYYFGFISLISPIANILLLPIFSFLIPTGFVIVFLVFLERLFLFIHFDHLIGYLETIIGIGTHFLLLFINKCALMLEKVPISFIEGNVKIGWICLYYCILFMGIFIFYFFLNKKVINLKLSYFKTEEFLYPERKNYLFGVNNNCGSNLQIIWINLKQRLRKLFSKKLICQKNKIVMFWLLIALILILLSLSYYISSNKPARLIMLDVEQGDAILFDLPKFHFQILFDGGPGERVLSSLGLALPFYENKIEMAFLTHEHQDHLEGFLPILDRYKVSSFFIPKMPSDSKTNQYKYLWETILTNKIPVFWKTQGDSFKIKDKNKDIFDLVILSPFFDYKRKISNINNESLVAKINFPKPILLTGDAEKGLMEALIYKNKDILAADILKVPHHGSRTSAFLPFLEIVNPKIALISVGKNNQFGHPAKMTVSDLIKIKSSVRRTDEEGSVVIEMTNGELKTDNP